MDTRKTPYRLLTAFVVTLLVVLALSLACAAPEPTPTPIPPAPPAPPVVPTAAPTPVVTAAPTLPTPMPVQPTPTRVLPTATPAVTGKVTYGGTLRYALTRGFDTMDPAYNSERGFRPILFTIFSNLVRLNPNGTVAPELARSWDFSQDGKVVTFHLQTGVKFQDGTSLDAQAVKWNYDRFMDSKIGSVRRAELIPPLERVEVVDSQTIRFYLSEPFRPLMPTLTTRTGQFASPAAVQKLNSYAERNGDFGRRPVGSGPFKLKEWLPDNRVVVVRNESYWEKGLPYLDAIELPIIGDQQVQFAMLRTGELDVMEEMRGSDVPIARTNPNVRVIEGGGARFRMLWLRLSKEPWNNKALREAFAYAMNRDTLVKVLYDGLATPAYQPIAPIYGVWYDPTYKAFEYNPQKAREKLREAGYPNGFSYVQPCSNSAFDLRWCEVFQVMVADVGIKAEIKPWVASTYATDFIQRKTDGPMLTGLTPRSDPHLLIQRYFHTRGAANFPYGVDYTNPEVDRLIDEGAKVYDVAKAKEIYQKASKLIVEDVAYVFHLYEPTLVGIRANVRNFAIHSDLEIRLRDLWFEK